MADANDPSFEEQERRVRESLGRLRKGLVEKLISIVKSREIPATTPGQATPRPLALPESDCAIRAAIAHTFTIAPVDAQRADSSFDQIAAEGTELSALLANSAAVLINGRRRLLLRDAARAEMLDRVHTTSRYRELLGAASKADEIGFAAISYDDERLPSAWLRSFLTGNHGDLEGAPARELRAAVEALERLQLVTFTSPPRPDLRTARRLRDLAELLEPLRILIGQQGGWEGRPLVDRFVGRKAYLAKLRAFVDELESQSVGESVDRFFSRTFQRARAIFGIRDESVFFVEARGGLGKSTLMAKFVLAHALSRDRPFPFAYLDFDRASLRPRDPGALLLEVARQVRLQLPDPIPRLDQLCARLREEMSHGASQATLDPCDEFRAIMREHITRADRPFLLVLDTMEVVQYDPESLQSILNFLSRLSGGESHQDFPELKIVAAGRADVPDLRTNAEERDESRRIALDALTLDEAREMADKLGGWLMRGEWDSAWASDVGGRKSDPPERREPLTLRVAVELLRNTPKEQRSDVAREIGRAGEEASEFFVGRLYERRILSHIRDPEVRRLAWPGLIFREVTLDLIRDPLAALCGVDPAHAVRLFQALAKEVWMVEHQGTNSLRHRTDLRARTLPLMRRHDPEKFAEVNAAAVNHFAARRNDDLAAWAEWIYHRLLAGERWEQVDVDWPHAHSHALSGAEKDFERNSEQHSYLLSRTAKRLLPPAQLAGVPLRLALDHVARTGQRLGAFDDSRIEPVLQDLSVRLTASHVATTLGHPARAVLLVKTGRWDIDASFDGAQDEWATHAAFASRFKRARLHSMTERVSAAESSPSFDERAFPMPARTIIQDLAYTRIKAPSAAIHIDGALAALLQASGPTPAPSDVAALRTAVVFGWETSRPAAKLWLQSQSTRLSAAIVPSISLAEVRALLAAGKRIRKLLRAEMEIVLGKLGVVWHEYLTVVRDPLMQPMRVSHPDIAKVIAAIVSALLEDDSIEGTRHLRNFFAARDEDWLVPLAYAAARTKGSAARRQLLNQRMESHVEYFDRGSLLSSKRKRPWTPKDVLGVFRAADQAGDMLGVARILEETDEGKREESNLAHLLAAHTAWREQIQLVLDEENAKNIADADPPPPLPVRHKEDIQKDRWGGVEERDGRRLDLRLGEVSAHDFDFDAIVRSTDGSVLFGPVIFYLHNTFPRSRITIRNIREQSWAALEEVNSFGVFTVGAQVRTKSGRWTSLEIDLKSLRDLPKRFLAR